MHGPGTPLNNPFLVSGFPQHPSGPPVPRHGFDAPTLAEIKKQFGNARALKDIKPIETPQSMLDSSVTLMEHQKLGLGWMTELEKKKGGLLADDMGLGKTIQTIACILHNVPPSSQTQFRREGGLVGRTLIVCPLAVLEQWAKEIYNKSGQKLRVYTHHGPKAANSVGATARKHIEIMRSHDVVLTTYQRLSSDWPKEKKKETEDRGSSHWGGHDAVDLLGSDEDDHDILRGEAGPLMQVKWYRVVLDESHTIKNVATRCSHAVMGLQAEKRWCLSGTPIQNSMNDLYSTMRFLEIKPWDEKK